LRDQDLKQELDLLFLTGQLTVDEYLERFHELASPDIDLSQDTVILSAETVRAIDRLYISKKIDNHERLRLAQFLTIGFCEDEPTIEALQARFSGKESPKRIGRFEILELLGRGGMGEVWRVRDPHTGVEFALKRVPADVSHNTAESENLKANFVLVHNLAHPNLANIKMLEYPTWPCSFTF
jgi:hypothetical protein